MDISLDGGTRSGFAVCASADAAESRIHGGGDSDAGAGNWREYGNFQPCGQHHVTHATRTASGAIVSFELDIETSGILCLEPRICRLRRMRHEGPGHGQLELLVLLSRFRQFPRSRTILSECRRIGGLRQRSPRLGRPDCNSWRATGERRILLDSGRKSSAGAFAIAGGRPGWE